MDLFLYIKNYGKIEILKINNIDALIFARLSYLHWETIADKFPLVLENVIGYLKEMKNNKQDDRLIRVLAQSKRFQKIVFTRFESVLNKEKEEQFAALTIKFKENSSYISYRGTTKSLVAFKEDLNMCYKIVAAQKDALKYLTKEKDKNLYIGGHSKGGNLAMYAGINSKFLIRHRIKSIYNFDGPGFLNIDDAFRRMKNKIINICPENDIVGCLLYNSAKKHYIKTLHGGIEAHNIYYWQVQNSDFAYGKIKADSEAFAYANIKVVTDFSDQKKQVILDYLFKFLERRQLQSFKNLTMDDFKRIINEIPSLDEKEKNDLKEMIKLFLKLAVIPTIKMMKKNNS